MEVDKVANNANKKMADIKLNMVADKEEDKEDKAADKVSDIVRHVESFLQHVSFIHMPKIFFDQIASSAPLPVNPSVALF